MNNKGNGSISIIIMMMTLILLIVLPLISLVFENYYISIISREIVDASYSAISSAFDSIDVGSSTNESLSFELDLERKFNNYLEYNLLLSDEENSRVDKFEKLEILEFSNLSIGDYDPTNSSFIERDTIHIIIQIQFEPIFLMSSVDENRIVDIHFDYEVPIDK